MLHVDEVETVSRRVAISDERTKVEIGYLYLVIMKTSDGTARAQIDDVFVVEAYRGKGHSNTLIQHAITIARGHGCKNIRLTSRFGRDRLHAHYEEMGFPKYGFTFRMDL